MMSEDNSDNEYDYDYDCNCDSPSLSPSPSPQFPVSTPEFVKRESQRNLQLVVTTAEVLHQPAMVAKQVVMECRWSSELVNERLDKETAKRVRMLDDDFIHREVNLQPAPAFAECTICSEACRPSDRVVIGACNHEIHRLCLTSLIDSKLQDRHLMPWDCPACNETFSPREYMTEEVSVLLIPHIHI